MNADIWSIGVVFYQLLYGTYPFNALSEADLLRKIKTQKVNFS
jgi:serine/threonine protein kinase